MKTPNRILVTALFALTFCSAAKADYVAPDIQHAPYGEVRLVVPITTADSAIWPWRLHNIGNANTVIAASGGTLQAKVVLYGAAVKMLVQPVEPKLKEAIDAARAAGVQINVCNFSLKGMNQDWHELYGVQQADVVPSGFAEVGWLAGHGWAVDPAN